MLKIKYTLTVGLLYVIAANCSSSFLLHAADISDPFELDTGITTDYVIKSGGSITIKDSGYINGSVSKDSSNTTDVININTNYNTVKDSYSTSFGTSDNKLSQINLNDSNLFISNDFYADNLNINNGKLTINSNTGIDITNITKTSNSTAIIDIKADYSTNTKFGTSSDKIDSIIINDTASLTLSNDAYVDNLTLSDNSSSALNLNSGSKVYGNIISNTTGNGTVNINTSYDAGTDTQFGSSTNSIGKVNITDGNSLTLGNVAYIDNTELKDNSSLTLGTDGAIIGNVYGTGTVNINREYQTTSEASDLANNIYNTNFGNSTTSLNSLVLSSTLTLNNNAYVDNLNLNDSSSVLVISSDGGVIGSIYGSTGTVNLNRNYNTSNTTDSNYYNTSFGTSTNSIGTLNIGNSTSGYNLTLGNIAYVDNLVLDNSNSSLTLNSNSAVVGTIYGSGILNINTDYSTTDVDTVSGNDTKIGSSSSSKIATVNVGQNSTDYGLTPEITATLDLNNDAYVETMNISNNSVLNINSSGSIDGTIIGSEDNQGIININKSYNTGTSNTIFGLEGNRIKQINITNNEFTLSNSAYVNNFNITSNESYTNTKRLFTMENNSAFTGSITLNKRDNDVLIGIALNENYMLELADLLSLINTGKNGSANITNDNEVYLNLIDRDTLTDGAIIDIASGKDYSNAGLTYNGIYMNLELQKSDTDLKLIVNSNRTPTLDKVSQATITSADIIDSWTFDKKTANENVLTASLQAISNKNEFFHAITNLTPDVSGLNVRIPTQSITSAVANINKRLNFLRTLKINGVSSTFMQNLSRRIPSYYDEYIKQRNLWWELFGGTLHQDTIDNIFGYDATFYGGTIGYDLDISPSFVFGTSYTFSFVDANDLDYIKSDRDNLRAITNNIDLYMMLYSKWQYLTLNIGGGFNIYNQKRKINLYDHNMTAKANYNGFSYYGGIEYGFNILMYNSNRQTNEKISKSEYDTVQRITKKLESYTEGKKNNFLILTPKVSLTYNNIMIDNYTEKGADAANLVIKTKDYDSLDINGGLSLTYNKSINTVVNFQTILNGLVSYSIKNNKIELDARYIDDDEIFKVYGIEKPDLTYNTGINFNLNFYEKINIGLSYDYIFGDGFDGQIVKFSVLYNF